MPEIIVKNAEPEAAGLKGDQPAAFRAIIRCLQEGQKTTTLVGYAGTGKTHLLASVAKWARRNGFEVKVAAPTHKAAGVIASKLQDPEIEVKTIHSLLGLRLEPDMNNDTGGRILRSSENVKPPKGLVICDEASMVGETLKRHIDTAPNVQWLFVGDLAQLPPVGEGVSELLDNPDAILTRVLRQGEGSEILNLATRIRDGDMSMKFREGRDVVRLDNLEDMVHRAAERFDSREYQADAGHCRILVYRNALREELNTILRSMLIKSKDPYVRDEWLVMYAPFSPDSSRLNVLSGYARTYERGQYGFKQAWRHFFEYKESLPKVRSQLHTSQEVRVIDAYEDTVHLEKNKYPVWMLYVGTLDEREYHIPVLKDEAKSMYEEARQEHVNNAMDASRRRNECEPSSPAWEEMEKERREHWGRFFALEETFASTDRAYAMTVHKAQGSTFDHAFVDVSDLMLAGGFKDRITYTAVTRPSKSLTLCM